VWIASYTCCLFSEHLRISPHTTRPPTHIIVRSLGLNETHIQSHYRYKRTIQMQARDPLSVAVVTSELVVESPEGAVVEYMTVQRVWHSTAL